MTYQPPPPPPPPPSRRRWPWLTAIPALLAAIGLSAVVLADGDDGPPTAVNDNGDEMTRLAAAGHDCTEASTPHVRVLDYGSGLSIQGEGNESDGVDVEVIACILFELDVPDIIVTRIDQTRALDGMQDASWDGIAATWTYHPDNGLQMILSEEE